MLKTIGDLRRTYGIAPYFGITACFFRAEEGLYPLIHMPAGDEMLLSGIVIGIRDSYSPNVYGDWFYSRHLHGDWSYRGWAAFYARKWSIGPVGIFYDGPEETRFSGSRIYFHNEADAVHFEMNLFGT